eukprot:3879566-Rhodomonas_salina.3
MYTVTVSSTGAPPPVLSGCGLCLQWIPTADILRVAACTSHVTAGDRSHVTRRSGSEARY